MPSWTRPACIGENGVRPDKWYRVELMYTPAQGLASGEGGSEAGEVSGRVDGKPIGTTKVKGMGIGTLTGSLDRLPRLGVEHKGNPESYKLLYRDMCLTTL